MTSYFFKEIEWETYQPSQVYVATETNVERHHSDLVAWGGTDILLVTEYHNLMSLEYNDINLYS